PDALPISPSIERRHLQLASTSNPPISAGPCLSRENPKHSQGGGVGTPDQMAKMRAKERRDNHANRTTTRRHNHIPLASQLHHSRERAEHPTAELLKLRSIHPTAQCPIQDDPQQAMPLNEHLPIPAAFRLPINLRQAVTLFRMPIKIRHHDRVGIELTPPLDDDWIKVERLGERRQSIALAAQGARYKRCTPLEPSLQLRSHEP